MSDQRALLRKLLSSFQVTLCGDAKAPARVKAVNTLLNSGHDLTVLDEKELNALWESLFFALWHAEMGRGCEEIIAAIERACRTSYELTRVGFQTIARKWYGLDQYRVDKVSHLARHLLPVLLDHQITLWLKRCRKSKKLGTGDISCKKLLKRTLDDVAKSFGLCYFLLEILAEEVSKTSLGIYDRLHIIVGKFELKANLIIFIYRQIIEFASDTKLDARLLRTFDQYVIKRFIEGVLPNESQLTQILVTLRLYQALDKYSTKTTGKCKALFNRWSIIIQEVHEKCINGEYFPVSIAPVKETIVLRPQLSW